MDPNTSFGLAFGGAITWIVAVIAVSILYRKSKGKPILPRVPPGARFSRKGISGHSYRHFWTQFGGARNCLMVAVVGRTLVVSPTFPFNLMFLPEIYDLEHTIPLSRITSAQVKPRLFGQTVDIRFTSATGQARRIVLYMRKGDQLVATMRS